MRLPLTKQEYLVKENDALDLSRQNNYFNLLQIFYLKFKIKIAVI